MQWEDHERQRESRRMSKRINHTMQQVNALSIFTSDFSNVIAQVINNCGTNSEPNAVQFPMTPMFPEYNLDSDDELPRGNEVDGFDGGGVALA